jgi:ribosomal-protein-alanine N-acetyltransferase
MEIALRRLRPEDVTQVAEIEREAFAPLGIGTPFKRELNNRYARYLVAYDREQVSEEPTVEANPEERPADSSLWGRMVRGMHSVVKRDPGVPPRSDIAGYVGIWFQGNEAHITEIAVREDLRGQGIGELLLIGSVRTAIEHGSAVLTLEARVSNFIAQRLYEKYSFKSAGIRKGYYSDNREDAVIMTTSPIHSADYQRTFQELQEAYLARWREICMEQ